MCQIQTRLCRIQRFCGKRQNKISSIQTILDLNLFKVQIKHSKQQQQQQQQHTLHQEKTNTSILVALSLAFSRDIQQHQKFRQN